MAKDTSNEARDSAQPMRKGAWRRLRSTAFGVLRWSVKDWLHRAISAGIVVMVLGSALAWHLTSAGDLPVAEPKPTIGRAFAALDGGRYEEARAIANQLREQAGLSYKEQSGPLYILGTVLAHDAAEQWNEERRRTLYLLAARYLEEARERGLPASRRADSLFLLGQCLYLSERYGDAIPVLEQALESNQSRRARIHLLLANCFYHAANPDLDQALEHGLAFVRAPDVEQREREETWLQLANIYLRRGDLTAAREALDHIVPRSKLAPSATLHKIRLAIEETDRAADRAPGNDITPYLNAYHQAIHDLRLLMASQTPSSEVSRGASYLIGVCHRQRAKRFAEANLKTEAKLEYEQSLKQFFRTQKLFYRYAEGIVAALEEPELLQHLGEYSKASEAYDRLIAELKGFEPYDNPWLSQEELVDRLRAAHSRFIEADQYEHAVSFARQLTMVLPEVEAAEMLAESLQRWSEHLEGRSKAEPWSDAEETLQAARRRWREAAVAYRRLAELHFATRQYPEDLWLTAHAFLRGRNYPQAVRAMQKYLEHESRQQRARGLLGLGEAYLALGNPQQGVKVLEDLIRFYPNHPLSYQARIVAARGYVLQGNYGRAETMLKSNLIQEDLTPRSREWRDSLFELGELFYRRGLHFDITSRLKGLNPPNAGDRRARTRNLEKAHRFFNQAAQRLNEAVERYPDAPQAILARYRLAESYRKGARYLINRLESETIEADKAVWRRQIYQLLGLAINEYSILEETLNSKQEARTLDRTEASIMRNSYFAHADSLFDLGRYAEAIRAYSSVSNRYQNDPISLEAFVQIAACYQRMGRFEDARGTMEQARVVLSRIPAEADFLATTRYSRDDWTELLDWLAAL